MDQASALDTFYISMSLGRGLDRKKIKTEKEDLKLLANVVYSLYLSFCRHQAEFDLI
jgi:hypothetical protein